MSQDSEVELGALRGAQPSTPPPSGTPRGKNAFTSALGSAWKGLQEAAADAPVVAEEPDMYADGAVFGKPKSTAYFDTVWQLEPPRMLRYRPSVLHSYGWIPLLLPRNFKGTVLCDRWLWIICFSQWLWMYFIANTGLYANLRDQKAFVLFFGTPYMSAILNICMVITFVLGLFVTLVVNRWWDIRVNYGVARSLSIELAYIASTNLRGAKGAAGATPEVLALTLAQNEFARSELVRYLNFAHLLLVCDAQRAEKGDFLDSPDKRFGRWLRKNLQRVPVLRQLLAVEAGLDSGLAGLGDVMGNPRSFLKSLQKVSVGIVSGVIGAVNDAKSAVRAVAQGKKLEMDDMGLEEASRARERLAVQRSAAAEVDFQQFYVMGLVTPEEWAVIRRCEKDGVPSWRTVYCWVATLMADAVAEGRVEEKVATGGGMQAMCLEIRNSCGRVFTMLNTQLPFTYVHLVSFVLHIYLASLSTYMGFVLAIGIPGVKWSIAVNQDVFASTLPASGLRQCAVNGVKLTNFTRGDCMTGTLYTSGTQPDAHGLAGTEGGGLLMQVEMYFTVLFATIIIKGLLSMHSLLENPFGTHPCKFPLRAFNIDHIRQTRAFLRNPEEREPCTVRTMFVSKLHAQPSEEVQADAATASGTADDGKAKGIHFVQGKNEQLHTDVQAATVHASI